MTLQELQRRKANVLNNVDMMIHTQKVRRDILSSIREQIVACDIDDTATLEEVNKTVVELMGKEPKGW